MTDQPDTLASALVQLQAALPHVTKDAENPHFRSRYASLAALTDALLPVMAKLGLAWVCRPTMYEGQFVLSYSLTHVSGDGMDGLYPLPASGTPQQIGSAITYARRYALSAVTGLVADDDDDDGNAAEQAHDQKPASVGLRADERDARGLMTAAQRREHARIANSDQPPRPADRTNDPADDVWAGQPAGEWSPVQGEDTHGSSNDKQWKTLGILYGQIGLADRDDRIADIRERVPEKRRAQINSAKDLSYVEAEAAIKALRPIAKATQEGK